MEFDNLIVDTNFLTFFRNNSEAVSKLTAHWNFRKSIEGNHENIPFFLKLIESISDNCRWITFKTVFIPYYKEIFGDDEKIHRFINDGEIKFDEWKKIIIENYSKSFPETELNEGQYFDFATNFNLHVIDDKTNSDCLLFKRDEVTHTLNICWVKDLNKTFIDLQFEVRGELFNEFPLSKNNPKFYLHETFVNNNRNLLKYTLNNFQHKLGFEMVNHGFEWGENYKYWKIDQNGFID